MPRKHRTERSSGYTVLLVDDDLEYLQATQLLLEREGHRVLTASDGPAALGIMRQQPIDLLLLDYMMPGMTGEQVVIELRQWDPYTQVILQTGYASEHPPRELLHRLDIQGYFDKSEGPDKLLLWTEVGLRSAYTIQLLNKSRRGLRYILDTTPHLHKIQPLNDLLQGILWQIAGLLGAVDSFPAIYPVGNAIRPSATLVESFVAMLGDDNQLIIRAGTGRFADQAHLEHCVEPDKLVLIYKALQRGQVQIIEESTLVPLSVGEVTLGAIYLDKPAFLDQDIEILHIFANQAAVAIQNTQLYEMAALDPLTGVYARRFFDQWLLRELRIAFRSRHPLSLLMLDVDHLKQINDSAGHLAGDQALATLGKLLRQTTRSSDIIGRYGGDEFTIIMPQTEMDGPEQVGRRILSALRNARAAGHCPLSCSMGLAMLPAYSSENVEIPHPLPPSFFERMAQALIRRADEALYKAKHDGGDGMYQSGSIEWEPFERQV